MPKNLNVQRYAFIVFFVIILVASSSILQSKGSSQDNNYYPFQLIMVANPENAHQNDRVDISLSITNIHFDDILNISVEFDDYNDLEFLNSSIPDLDVENETDERSYQIGDLHVDEFFLFSVEFNVTSSATKTITINGMNVSYHLRNGLSSYVISNTVAILLKGEKKVSETGSRLILPKYDSPDDNLIYFAYLFPIIMFGVSVVFLKRLRR
jgi:hypothetical protein